MKTVRLGVFGLAAALLVASVTASSAPALAPTSVRDDSKYRVFCADNKIEVEQHTIDQEQSARGSNVCMLAEFDYASDADKYAEDHGGKGSPCKCN